MATKTSNRFQILPGLNFLCRQRSSQPLKSVSIDSGTTPIPGKRLNRRYQVIQPLANGGFSQTYLAKDIHKPSHPTCVVKHFKPASSDPSFLQTAQQLFYTEAETLEKLGHHNQIPQLLGYFEEEQAFYLVQEYIDGLLLSTEMPLGYCWSESQAIQLLQEVLELLVFIHSHDLIHRDIKPQNLIRRSSDNKIVLIDFGTIKQIRTQTVTPQGHRSATTPMGTQGYIAPEQGQGNPRPNSDLYALGITSIQALTGLDPLQFQQDPNTGEISWQQQAEVSPELASVISKMVAYHFKERYQSATEALKALQSLTNAQSADLTRHLLSQVETSAQQPPIPSILLSQFPSSELIETASFSINPSEQPADSKNRRWIWNGVGTGLASAVFLSTVIPLIPDSPAEEQKSAPKPGSSVQRDAKQQSAKYAPAKGDATPDSPGSTSSPHREERFQAANTRPSSRVSRISPPQTEPRLVREASPDLPRETTKLIAATANSPAKQTQPSQTPSNPPTHQLALSPKAASTESSGQSMREVQGPTPESRVTKSRAELEGNLAELKAAFSKLAEAIALTDKALAQGEEAPQDTFSNLGGAIAQQQQHVETLPSEKPTQDRTASSTNSSDRRHVESPDKEVVPTEELEEAEASTAESEMISTPTPESVSEAMPEEQSEEGETPVNSSTEEPSSEAVSEQPEPSEELMEEPTVPSSDLPAEQAEEAVSEEQLEGEVAPNNSLTQEPESASEAVSAEELEVSPDLEAVSEEQLERATPAKSPVMSPDGQLLAGISVDSTIKIWNVQTGELLSTLKGSRNIQSITISSDSKTLTSVSADDTTETWNLPTGELVETPTDYSNPA